MAWGRHAEHHVIYVNVGYAIPWSFLKSAGIDALILDTTFCSMHWTPDYFRARAALCTEAASLTCPKIAIVQDEFTNIDLVAEFLERIAVTHVLTCSKESDWPKFYPTLVAKQVTFRTVLTGYVDPSRAYRIGLPPSRRPIDIGYRGGRNPFWLGQQGRLKSEIGEKVQIAASKLDLATDIAHPESTQYLKGDQWFDFLHRCRCVIGVEGGASINDHDGAVHRSVEAYLAMQPDAQFEEVKAACFASRDGEVDLACLSPRHLEAAATRTAQLLVEGNYNGVLKPWEHYIPLKADGSNMAEALTAVMDDAGVDAMVERAYRDIVADGRWSYPTFVRQIETEIINTWHSGDNGSGKGSILARWVLQARAGLLWHFAHWEASGGFKRGVSWLARAARRLEAIGPLGGMIRFLRQRARQVLGITPDKASGKDQN